VISSAAYANVRMNGAARKYRMVNKEVKTGTISDAAFEYSTYCRSFCRVKPSEQVDISQRNKGVTRLIGTGARRKG
jgi:hypothetical protein